MLDIYKRLARHLQYTRFVRSVFLISFIGSFDLEGLAVLILNQAITDKWHPRSNAGPQSQESQLN